VDRVDDRPHHEHNDRDTEAPHQPVEGRPEDSKKHQLGVLRRRVTDDLHHRDNERAERDDKDQGGQYSENQQIAAAANRSPRSCLLGAAILLVPVQVLEEAVDGSAQRARLTAPARR